MFMYEAAAIACDAFTERQKDLVIAVALTEFSVHYEDADPELSSEAWQLTADRLVDHDVEPQEAVAELDVS